jgi:DNA mismatch endonuclease, patch repair protein
MDTISRRERSEVMARVRAKDTRPELAVRRLVHSMGYRYRLHRRDIPGIPDLAFIRARKLIFVHGCFWHRHARCRNTRTPKSNIAFWEAKLASNRRRDVINRRRLASLGWSILVVWECELSDLGRLRRVVAEFLGG